MFKYISRITAFISILSLVVMSPLVADDNMIDKYSFTKAPYIHPKIIEDLTSWANDPGEQVVAINLPESMGTNRYFGAIKTLQDKPPSVIYEDNNECLNRECPFGPPFFGYHQIGKTRGGIYVLMTESSGGGTGRFRNLLLVTLKKDIGMSYDKITRMMRYDRERLIIQKLAQITLGDRYAGEIRLIGDELHIGKDQYFNSAGLFKENTVLKLDAIH